MDNQNVRTRGRPRKYQGTLQERVAQAQATFQQARQIGRVNINAQTRGQVVLGAQNIRRRGRPSKNNPQLEQALNVERNQRNLNRALFKPSLQRRIFFMKPTNVSFDSYNEYTIYNKYPEIIPVTHTTVEDYMELESVDDVDTIYEDDMEKFIAFYKIANYLKSKKGHKVYLSMEFLRAIRNADSTLGIKEEGITSKAVIIINENDVYKVIKDFIKNAINYIDSYNLLLFQILSLTVSVAKVNSLTGSSYIPLPDWINNKKACINIKNEDNLCFVYSVLCGINTPKIHPERVSHYKNINNNLIYKDEDMPMCINKIIYFEKKNKLRINVFGIEKKDIITLYNTHLKTNTDYPLINLLYFVDEGKKHYCYVKDLSRLLSNQSNEKNSHHKNLVCPYCLQFSTNSGHSEAAMKKHQEYCISGQRCNMPKDDFIKFKHYNNIIKCPIRIYADFEAINKKEDIKSKNGNTSYDTNHKGVSFKFQCVSELPLKGFRKVGNKYTKTFLYVGYDSPKIFVEEMTILEAEITKQLQAYQYNNKIFDNSSMTQQEQEEYTKCKECHLCKCSFSNQNNKVRHHNHNTGEYISPLCNNCNIKIKAKIYIPVFFHNLNYDKNIFFTSLVHFEKDKKQVNILPNNEQSFKSFTVGNLHFTDSMSHLPSSLESLLKNLPNDKKIFLRELAKDYEEFEIMNKKNLFPYEWFDDIEKLKIPIKNLKQEHFKNKLSKQELTDIQWVSIKYIIKKVGMKTFEDYHNFYLDIDVSGLADVMENYIDISIENYGLDPCYYVGTPSFGWDAMLLKTGIELEFLKDIEMYLFYERGIRGGQSVIFEKFCKGNNKYLSDYDPNLKNIFISYLDANNLYGWAMIKKLPYSGFQWVDPLTEDFIMNYEESNEKGYTLEVDLHYPKELHDVHNDYPLAPEKIKLGICEKLCGTFYDKKDYVVDIRNLQFYLKQGMKLIKVNRVIEYNHKTWLKPWIDFNTEKRKKAKNDFEKDYFKLMNNSVFGKTMENVRGRINLKVAFDDVYQKKYQSKPNWKSTKPYHIDNKTFSIMNLSKTTVNLDKPIYAGFSILDLSKLHMYDFHYNVMKPKYGDKIQLLMTDTDSFVYKIETEDFYKDMYDDKDNYDMSEYDKDYQYYDETNKKVLGKFKDEKPKSTISEFVGVRPKCYSMMCNDGENTKKLKGVPKVVVKKDIIHNDYKKCVLENKPLQVEINAIRCKGLNNYSLTQTKKALSNTDDKRVWNDIKSLAYGHYSLKSV